MGDSVFDSIKSAANKITNSTEQIIDSASKINIDKISATYDSMEDKLSKLKDKALDYIPDINIDQIEEKLELIGYRIPRVEIAVTIPPRIAFEIDLNKSIIDKKIQDSILQEDIDLTSNNITHRVLVKIIQGLDSAIKLKDKLHFSNKELSRVSIEGSLIPTVKLIYLDKREVYNESKMD